LVKKNSNYNKKMKGGKKMKEKYEEESGFGEAEFFLGVFMGAILIILILAITGEFNKPYEQVGISEDTLARYHVLKYYPEYEDCSITYGAINSNCGFNDCPGAIVSCNKIDKRDGMRVNLETQPTIELIFEDITLNDIFKDLLRERL